ncbi:MAG: hypothetical protein PVF66_06670 [Candidatus Aminicenantes bacterium]
MKNRMVNKYFKISLILFILVSVLNGKAILLDTEEVTSLIGLLPKVEDWKYSEEPQNFIPGNLYEYINGAAEIYLAYDFKELIVGQYEKDKEVEEASLSIEIYDMGNEKNSFGIYSAERFSESQFIPIGNQGYLEEGTLNFVVGRYYIKLLCFDCGEKSDEILKSFSNRIVKRVKDKGQFPPALSHFPQEGLIQNTEKYILRNFMGYGFLHDGYVASYLIKDQEFDCFIIEGKNEEDAQKMLEQYLEKKSNVDIKETSMGYLIKDRYYHNIFLARSQNHICGVMKIKDDFHELGVRYLRMLLESLEK